MRLLRAILVVSGFGAFAGAVVGMLAMLIIVGIRRGVGLDGSMLGAAALFGGAFGLALGPMVGFGLLRDVPLWKAIAGTAVGALAGFAIGWAAKIQPFLLAVVGMLLAAVVLRLLARRGRAAAPPSSPVA